MTKAVQSSPAKRKPLRTGGSAWGPQRVRLGISLRQLSEATGINRGILSMMERGRVVPRGDEWDAVMAALRDAEAQPQEGSTA